MRELVFLGLIQHFSCTHLPETANSFIGPFAARFYTASQDPKPFRLKASRAPADGARVVLIDGEGVGPSLAFRLLASLRLVRLSSAYACGVKLIENSHQDLHCCTLSAKHLLAPLWKEGIEWVGRPVIGVLISATRNDFSPCLFCASSAPAPLQCRLRLQTQSGRSAGQCRGCIS